MNLEWLRRLKTEGIDDVGQYEDLLNAVAV
jgi:hypothetical protein